jgi:hypothetical protein
MGMATEFFQYGPFVVDVWPSWAEGRFRFSIQWPDLMPKVESGFDDEIAAGVAATYEEAVAQSRERLTAIITSIQGQLNQALTDIKQA